MHDAESPANLSGAQDLARGFNAFGLRLYGEVSWVRAATASFLP